jgi:hypothetical protein
LILLSFSAIFIEGKIRKNIKIALMERKIVMLCGKICNTLDIQLRRQLEPLMEKSVNRQRTIQLKKVRHGSAGVALDQAHCMTLNYASSPSRELVYFW